MKLFKFKPKETQQPQTQQQESVKQKDKKSYLSIWKVFGRKNNQNINKETTEEATEDGETTPELMPKSKKDLIATEPETIKETEIKKSNQISDYEKPSEPTASIKDHSRILTPGPLPPELKPKQSRKSIPESEEKQLKIKEICQILRGEKALPQEMIEKYKILSLLGDGAFGYVFAAKEKSTNKEAAIKCIIKSKIPQDSYVNDQKYGYIPFEAHFLSKINHPKIIQFLDLYQDPNFYYLVTELHGTEWRSDNPQLEGKEGEGLKLSREFRETVDIVEKMEEEKREWRDDEIYGSRRAPCDLFEFIDLHRKMPEDIGKKICAQIVEAVSFMHSIGYVHRDLKDENVVIDADYNVKLIDFGSTSKIPPLHPEGLGYFDRFNGTLHFASPEILQGYQYRGPEAEVWALGVLIYTIMWRENPFTITDDIVKYKIKFDRNDGGGYERDGYVSLVKEILNPVPEKRITMEGIKRHPWLREYFQQQSTN